MYHTAVEMAPPHHQTSQQGQLFPGKAGSFLPGETGRTAPGVESTHSAPPMVPVNTKLLNELASTVASVVPVTHVVGGAAGSSAANATATTTATASSAGQWIDFGPDNGHPEGHPRPVPVKPPPLLLLPGSKTLSTSQQPPPPSTKMPEPSAESKAMLAEITEFCTQLGKANNSNTFTFTNLCVLCGVVLVRSRLHAYAY